MSSCNDTGSDNGTSTCVDSATDASLVVALITNAAVFAVVCLVFLIVRRRCRRVYLKPSSPPLKDDSFLVGPFTSALGVSYAEMEEDRALSLDQIMYLRVLATCFRIVAGYCVVGVALAIVHATAGGSASGTGVIGMANVPRGSPFFVADLVSVLLNTLIAIHGFYSLFRDYVELRLRYKRNSCVENYSVLVTDIPASTSEQQVSDAFVAVYQDTVTAVFKAYETPKLWEIIEARSKALLKWEDCEAYFRKKGKRKEARATFCGAKTDAIRLHELQFRDLDEQLAEGAARLYESDGAGAAFVVFSSRLVAQQAAQSVFRHTHRPRHPLKREWSVQSAPPPQAVNWEALGVSRTSAFVRSVLVSIAVFLLVFLWMIPISFASSFSNLHTLETVLPFLGPLLSLLPTAVTGLIAGILPGLVLIIFMAILVSLIITPLARAEKPASNSGVLHSVFSKYYLFLLINVFFGSIFASGALSVLPQLVDDPSVQTIVSLLGHTFPKQAPYFCNYVLILSMTGSAFDLLRIGDLVGRFVVQRWIAHSQRDMEAAQGPIYFDMHVRMATHLIVFVIASTFATMNPIILPFAAIYFGLQHLSARYNCLFVFSIANDDQQGTMFPAIFNRAMFSLVVAQATLAGVLGASKFPGAPVLILSSLVTALFWYYANAQLVPSAAFGALSSGDVKSTASAAIDTTDAYAFPTLRKPLLQLGQASTPQWWNIHDAPEHVTNSEGDGGEHQPLLKSVNEL